MSNYFHPVPGSARLRTAASGANKILDHVEGLDAGVFEQQLVDGETLGRAVVRDRFVPVLRAVFDDLAPLQAPIEQLLYLHLYRHSYGEDRNHCRLARRELGQRTGLSPRRFNCALAGLVRKGHVHLVQRDRRGTLYRVLLPSEILSGRVGSEVLLGKLRSEPATSALLGTEQGTESQNAAQHVTGAGGARRRPQATVADPGRKVGRSTTPNRHHKMTSIDRTPEEIPQEVDAAPANSAAAASVPSVGQVVEAVLARVMARKRTSAAQDVLQDVLELLEEGFLPQQLLAQAGSFNPGRLAPEFARVVRSTVGSQKSGSRG